MRPPTLEAAGQPAKNGMKLPIAPVSALNVLVLFAFDYPISIGLPTRLLSSDSTISPIVCRVKR